jgi:hypothetical protein
MPGGQKRLICRCRQRLSTRKMCRAAFDLLTQKVKIREMCRILRRFRLLFSKYRAYEK